MRVAKRYIAKVERTLYTIDTVHIVAESEEEILSHMNLAHLDTLRLYGTKLLG